MDIKNAEKAPFSDEPPSIERLNLIDKDWHPLTLTEIRNQSQGRIVRIYTDGVFDLFHHGHAQQLRQIKQLIPNSYLIAGVCSDEDTLKYKYGSTVMTTTERCELVSHCRYVDEVHRSPPFFPTIEFVDSLKVDLVSHDCIPYPVGTSIEDCYAPFKKADRFIETKRTPNISTTLLIQRVLENFEIYKKRQIARMA